MTAEGTLGAEISLLGDADQDGLKDALVMKGLQRGTRHYHRILFSGVLESSQPRKNSSHFYFLQFSATTSIFFIFFISIGLLIFSISIFLKITFSSHVSMQSCSEFLCCFFRMKSQKGAEQWVKSEPVILSLISIRPQEEYFIITFFLLIFISYFYYFLFRIIFIVFILLTTTPKGAFMTPTTHLSAHSLSVCVFPLSKLRYSPTNFRFDFQWMPSLNTRREFYCKPVRKKKYHRTGLVVGFMQFSLQIAKF